VALFFALQPAPGTFGNSVEFSTSQFIALVSGITASIAHAIYYKAALARPKHAMDLGLPPEFAPAGAAVPAADDADDDDEEEPVRRPPPKKKTKGQLKGKKPAPKPAPPVEDDDSPHKDEKDEKDGADDAGGAGGEPVKVS
jgi:phosphatidylglycerol:prolipoprotein diacylglycerol transferase